MPYHAFVPRRLASASPPCSCGCAGAFLWGGLARTWRDGGLQKPPPALQMCWALLQRSTPITSSAWSLKRDPTAAVESPLPSSTEMCSQEKFQDCCAVVGSTLGELCPFFPVRLTWCDSTQMVQSRSQMSHRQGQRIKAETFLSHGGSPSSSLLSVDGVVQRKSECFQM